MSARLDLSKPYAVLADVRSNVTALNAALDDLKSKGVEQGVILGDLLGHGPDPVDVLTLLYNLRDRYVVLHGHPTSGFFKNKNNNIYHSTRSQNLLWLVEQLKPKCGQAVRRSRFGTGFYRYHLIMSVPMLLLFVVRLFNLNQNYCQL